MKRSVRFIAVGLGISLILAFFFSALASSFPDGLEKVIERLVAGREIEETGRVPFAPLPEYGFPGVHSEWLSTGIAGVIGTVVVFAAVLFLGKALAKRKSSARTGRESD